LEAGSIGVDLELAGHSRARRIEALADDRVLRAVLGAVLPDGHERAVRADRNRRSRLSTGEIAVDLEVLADRHAAWPSVNRLIWNSAPSRAPVEEKRWPKTPSMEQPSCARLDQTTTNAPPEFIATARARGSATSTSSWSASAAFERRE
jgi:hypothetical protein